MLLAVLLIASQPAAASEAARPLRSPAPGVLAVGGPEMRDTLERLAAIARECGLSGAVARIWQESDGPPSPRRAGEPWYVVDPGEDIRPRREALTCYGQTMRRVLIGEDD